MERKLSRSKRKFSQLQAYKQQQECTFLQIFLQASHYPAFFNENLIDNERNIKVFHNEPYAHQTIFYFQLLKLTYQNQDVDFKKYLVKIYDLLDNPEFEFVTPDQGNYYYLGIGEARIRKMMQQFLDELGQGKLGVTQIITKYPIIDKIMILFLRTILIVAGKCQTFDDYIQPVEIYEFLALYFEIQITYYSNCLRFNQSDLFVYFQAENEIYLAYTTPKTTQQQITSFEQLYRKDPEEAFNISSVKQMVSEIDMPIQEQCFNLSKNNQSSNQTEFVEYDYSQSQEARHLSKSIQQNSQLRFSHLINDQSGLFQNMSVIKSNKVLQKEINGQRKVQTIQHGRMGWKNMECFEIEQAPLQLQNANSPAATPKLTCMQSFSKKDISSEKESYNIYQKVADKTQTIPDIIKQQYDLLSTGQSDRGYGFKPKKQNSKWQILYQAQKVLKNQQQKLQQQPQKILRSIYEMRSIKSIMSHNESESYVLDTPKRASNNQSRKQSIQGFSRRNQYTRFGYINNNISNEFTSSMVLQEMQQPFKVKIETIKQKARKQRKKIQNMIYF